MDLKKGLKEMEQRTKRQIDELKIKKGKPLFICDADEVILYFAKHFKAFLNTHGWDLNLSGYRLDNAIFHKNEGHLAEKRIAKIKLIFKRVPSHITGSNALS